jgi:hypothetical protein
MLACSGRRTSRGPGWGAAHDPLSTLPTGVPAALGRRLPRPPTAPRTPYGSPEPSDSLCACRSRIAHVGPRDRWLAPRPCLVQSATAPFRPTTRHPPGGHLDKPHPSRCLRDRSMAAVGRAPRPPGGTCPWVGCVGAPIVSWGLADEQPIPGVRASHSIVGMVLERWICTPPDRGLRAASERIGHAIHRWTTASGGKLPSG